MVMEEYQDLPNSTTSPSAGAGVEADPGPARFDRVIFQLLGTTGIIVNTIAIVVMTGDGARVMSRIPRLFVINQSSIDLSAALFVIFAQHWSFTVSKYLPEGISNPHPFCKYFWSTYMVWSLLGSSTANFLILTVERYLSICHATWHRTHLTRRVVFALMIIAWPLGFAEKQYMTQFHYVKRDHSCVRWAAANAIETFQGTYNFIYMVILPVIIVPYCYGRILLTLRGRSKLVRLRVTNKVGSSAGSTVSGVAGSSRVGRVQLVEQATSSKLGTTAGSVTIATLGPVGSATAKLGTGNNPATTKSNELDSRRNRSLLYMFSTIGVGYLICYLPNQITWYQFTLGGPLDANGFWYPFTVALAFTNCCINPFIYTLRLPAFRMALLRRLGCRAATIVAADQTYAGGTNN